MMKLPEKVDSVVVVDTETSGLFPDDGARISCVSVAYRLDGRLVVDAWPFDQGIRDKLGAEQLDLLSGEDPNLGHGAWLALLQWLRSQLLVAQNAKFDMTMLKAGTRKWAGLDLADRFVWDTALAEMVLMPQVGHSLEEIAERRNLGQPKDASAIKSWLKTHRLPPYRYDLVPWEVIEPYARNDAELEFLLWERQVEEFEAINEGQRNGDLDYAGRLSRELELELALYRMEQRGIGYAADESLEIAERLEETRDQLVDRLPWRTSNINDAKKYFFKQAGVIPYKVTDKGAPGLDDEVVKLMIKDDVLWAAEWGQVQKINTAISRWYLGYVEKMGTDGRLRASFRQNRVVSGRLSVERVQLHAIPKNDKMLAGVPSVRSLIRPREGAKLWNLDMQQAELRVASQYAQCISMLRMLGEGADFHSATAEKVLGAVRGTEAWGWQRDAAKRLNFASIFQVGPATFQRTLAEDAGIYITEQAAAEYVFGWRNTYPEFGWAHKKAERFVEKHGYVRTLPGTPYEWRSYFKEHEETKDAWSRIVQGSLAEFLRLWMIKVEDEYPGIMVLTVHDSLVLETDAANDYVVSEVAEIGKSLATALFRVEMPVEVKAWEAG